MATLDIPDSVRCWQIGDGNGNVRSINGWQEGRGYNQFCRTNGEFLTSQKQKLGINLGYTSDRERRRNFFRVPDGTERDILSGELVAFGIGKDPSYLKYGTRKFGINLDWSEKPRYEWKVFGGEEGTPIAQNSPVALVNVDVDGAPDFLIYFDRAYPGVCNLGWTGSPDIWDSVLSLADKHKVTIAKAAVGAV